jgi:hypothetical protein
VSSEALFFLVIVRREGRLYENSLTIAPALRTTGDVHRERVSPFKSIRNMRIFHTAGATDEAADYFTAPMIFSIHSLIGGHWNNRIEKRQYNHQDTKTLRKY